MLSGIYTAEFLSNQSLMGRGVAIFTENAIHGGDAAFYYKGKYRRDGENRISAEVQVIDYSGRNNRSLVRSGCFGLRLLASKKINSLLWWGKSKDSQT
jgi:hypothetical protein